MEKRLNLAPFGSDPYRFNVYLMFCRKSLGLIQPPGPTNTQTQYDLLSRLQLEHGQRQ